MGIFACPRSRFADRSSIVQRNCFFTFSHKPDGNLNSKAMSGTTFAPTIVFDTYWEFAAERHRIYEKRVRGEPQPWTTDPIL
jgi:alpha-glutamyl/putrescinyl thymine pyrophosphorylase clade 1